MGKCKIKYCSSEKKKNVSYFCVPFEHAMRKKWIHAIEIHQEFNYKIANYRICEEHFKSEDIMKQNTKKKLIAGAVPSVFP